MLLHTCWEACSNSYILFLFTVVLLLSACTLASDIKHTSTWVPVTKQRWVNMLQLRTLEHIAMTSAQQILTRCRSIFPGMLYSKSWHLFYAHINWDDTHGYTSFVYRSEMHRRHLPEFAPVHDNQATKIPLLKLINIFVFLNERVK